jgi:hypothetical protein
MYSILIQTLNSIQQQRLKFHFLLYSSEQYLQQAITVIQTRTPALCNTSVVRSTTPIATHTCNSALKLRSASSEHYVTTPHSTL